MDYCFRRLSHGKVQREIKNFYDEIFPLSFRSSISLVFILTRNVNISLGVGFLEVMVKTVFITCMKEYGLHKL